MIDLENTANLKDKNGERFEMLNLSKCPDYDLQACLHVLENTK